MRVGAQLLFKYYLERKVCAECQVHVRCHQFCLLFCFLSLFLAPDSFINQSDLSLYKWSREKPYVCKLNLCVKILSVWEC